MTAVLTRTLSRRCQRESACVGHDDETVESNKGDGVDARGEKDQWTWYRETDAKDNGHRQEVDRKVDDDVQIHLSLPRILGVTLGTRGWEIHVPPRGQVFAGRDEHDDGEHVIDHDNCEEGVGSAADLGGIPDADVKQNHRQLNAPEGYFVEEGGPPGDLGRGKWHAN